MKKKRHIEIINIGALWWIIRDEANLNSSGGSLYQAFSISSISKGHKVALTRGKQHMYNVYLVETGAFQWSVTQYKNASSPVVSKSDWRRK